MLDVRIGSWQAAGACADTLDGGSERIVRRLLRAVRGTFFPALLPMIVGCVAAPSVSSPTAVVIQSLGAVDGTWEGTIHVIDAADASRVILILADHDTYATYSFAATGEMDPLFGDGRLRLQDGRLFSEAGDRTLTFSLAERKGTRVLLVSGTGKQGQSYVGELERAK